MLCGGLAAAQDLRYLRHQAWSTEEGLPQDSVHGIAQGGDGFLWVGTERGLARFDGVGFKVFGRGNEAAFASDDICCVATAWDGSLWVGTGDGVVRWKDGRFWREGGGAVLGLAREGDGRVRVETAPAEGRRVGGGWGFGKTEVTDGAGRRWRAGVELPGSRIETMLVDREGRAWVGTNDGLAAVGASGVQVVGALRGIAVLCLFEDAEGDLWVGTETSGLHVLRQGRFRNEAGLADKALTAVVEASDGAVWVGTRKDGLLRVRDGVVDEPVRAEALTSPFILSLAPGAAGSVWVGTPDGLNHVSATGAVERITSVEGLPDDYILSLASGRDGAVWVGTRHGLVRLVGGRMEVLTTADGLTGDLIGALLVGAGGELWIGSSGGLSRLGVDGKITQEGGMAISSIAQAAGGTIWVAYRDGGLGRVAGGQSRAFLDGALGGRYAGLAVESGFLLLRDESGLARMALAQVNGCFDGGPCNVQVRRYGLADGMPSVDVVASGSPVFWRMGNGEVWTTTRRGVAVFDPARLAGRAEPPPVAIEQLLVDEKLVDGTTAGAIPFGRVRYTVDYVGLSYAAPWEVQYQVRLEGLEAVLTEVGGRRTATYTNLPPGEYRFRVQARLGDGSWGEGASISFRVVPPFYRRWWFLGLVGLGVVGLGAWLYRLRVRRLEGRFDAVLKERNRMAREIHDTLAQDFVGVTLQLDLIAQMLGMGKIEAAEEQVRVTRGLVTEGLAEARQSIWALRANPGSEGLPTRLGKVVQRYPGVRVGLKIGGAYRKLDGRVEAEVLRVAQESLSNVERHSGARTALVELHYGGDRLVLTVTDDGSGFEVAEREGAAGHYGLGGMKERAEVVGGRLEIASAAGAGTKVTLTVPLDGVEG